MVFKLDLSDEGGWDMASIYFCCDIVSSHPGLAGRTTIMENQDVSYPTEMDRCFLGFYRLLP